MYELFSETRYSQTCVWDQLSNQPDSRRLTLNMDRVQFADSFNSCAVTTRIDEQDASLRASAETGKRGWKQTRIVQFLGSKIAVGVRNDQSSR